MWYRNSCKLDNRIAVSSLVFAELNILIKCFNNLTCSSAVIQTSC